MKKGRIILSLVVILIVSFTFLFGGYIFNASREEVKAQKGIITLWHIDTFEGGVGSRKQFLLKVADMYEKTNDGALIMVIGYTAEGAENEMENGNFPDLLSFGNGVKLRRYATLNSSGKCLEGEYLGEQAAYVWAKGNYAIFSKCEVPKNLESITVSQANYTLPLAAFSLSGYRAKTINEKKPLDAYYDFVNGKSDYLLGTQRDLFRLINRGFSFSLTTLGEFSDLNQFIAITTEDMDKIRTGKGFVDFLMSEKIQSTLYKVGLFSAVTKVRYDDERLDQMSALKTRGISVMTGSEKISEIAELSALSSRGDENAFKKLNNVVFLP